MRQMTRLTLTISLSIALGFTTGCENKTASSATHRSEAAPAVMEKPVVERYPLPERMRGINTQTDHGCPTPEMARIFSQWGVNAVRINFETDAAAQGIPDEQGPAPTDQNPLAPYSKNIGLLKEFTKACKEYNIKVVVAADGIYGRRLDYFYKSGGDDFRKGLKKHILDFWKAFAIEFKDDPSIVIYDVLNEPNYSGNSPSQDNGDVWSKDIFPSALAQIRSVNPDIWVMVMAWPWGLAVGMDTLPVYEDKHIIYSFHTYSPHEYTHQGVGSNKAKRGEYTYPGMMQEYDSSPMEKWDRAKYVEAIQAAINFKKKNNVRILVGEFGVIRWAPGREQYITDVISVFEEQGFDWLFHSYGAWNGWNPSFAADSPEATSPPASVDGGIHTGVHQILLENWARNNASQKTAASK
jgi:endoglucanase